MVCKLSTASWSILVEAFPIFADVNDSFFMVWNSSMKNDFIAIILSHSFTPSESKRWPNNRIWMKRLRCAASYKWSYIRSSNSWVRYVSRNDRVRYYTNDVTIYLRRNTNIILCDWKIGKIWWQCNQRFKIFMNNAFVCISFKFASHDSLCQFDVPALVR